MAEAMINNTADCLPRYMASAQARWYIGCKSQKTFRKYSKYLTAIKLPDGAVRYDRLDIDKFMTSLREDVEDQAILDRLTQRGI